MKTLPLNTTYLSVVEGKVFKKDDGTDLTTQGVLLQALVAEFTDEQNKNTIEDKVARFALFSKINKAGEFVNLKAEEVVMLKLRIAKVFHLEVAGPLLEELDAPEVKSVEEVPAVAV